MVFLDQTLIKTEHNNMQWVVKFVQKWNLTQSPYNLTWEKYSLLELQNNVPTFNFQNLSIFFLFWK